MSDKKMESYDLKRVDKVSLTVTWAIILVFIFNTLISGGISEALSDAVKSIPIALLSTAIFFLHFNRVVKSLLFGVIPALAMMALFCLGQFTVDKHYVLFAATALIALYFDSRVVLAYSAVINILMIVTYIIAGQRFVGPGTGFIDFTSLLVVFNGSLIVLYYLTRWGGEHLQDALYKKRESEALLSRLQGVFNELERGAGLLDTNISSVNKTIETTKEASSNIIIAMNEMSRAIQEEASSIYKTNETMNDSMTIVQETRNVTSVIADKSREMSEKIEEGTAKISEMAR